MNTRSIRFRLAVWHSVLLAVVFAALAALLYVLVKHYLEDALFAIEARRARQIGETLLDPGRATDEPTVAREIHELYFPEAANRFIRISRRDATMLYLSGAPSDHSYDPSRVAPAPAGSSPSFRRVQAVAGSHSLLIAAAWSHGAEPYLVEVGTSAEPVDRFAGHLLVLLAVGIPLLGLVAAAGGYLLVRTTLTPVTEMTNRAQRISQHNLGERLPNPGTDDELERLAQALNHMITRLDEAFTISKRFVADASHELRTPLTVIQGELEAMAADPLMPGALRERIGSMLEEVERLAGIVQQLLALSRLDAGEARGEWMRLDLSGLVRATAEQMLLLAEDRLIAVRFEINQQVFVMGDRARLKQVVVNLLDNAIKFTAPGGSVQLRVATEGGTALVEVSDTGAGIAPNDQPLVFERFFRADRRERSTESGAGLGLAIVRSICGAHGGSVLVRSELGSGSTFTVRLPVAPPL